MATRSAGALPLQVPYQVAFDATLRALAELGLNVRFADPAQGYIQGSSSMGLASWGEDLDLYVRATGPESSLVEVRSALKFGLVDWGKNQKNVTKVHEAIMRSLGAGAPALSAAPVPAGAWHPDPSGRHELRRFDGQQWTPSVLDAGVPGTDPI